MNYYCDYVNGAVTLVTMFTPDSFGSFNNILINDTYHGMPGVLMFGRVQSLAESKIGRFRVEEGVCLVRVIQGAATERHH